MKILRHVHLRDRPSSGVQVHLYRSSSGIHRPIDFAATTQGHRRVAGVGFRVRDGDHGRVVDDEVTEDFRKGVDEALCGGCGVEGEVGCEVRAVERRGDGILVFPTLFLYPRIGAARVSSRRWRREGFGKPIRWTCKRRFTVYIEDFLLQAGGELGLIESSRTAVTECVEQWC